MLRPPAIVSHRSLRERQQETVRSTIMDVGIALFLERGFVDTTVDMIALAAGVSRRTVFRHFSAKEEIIIAWSHISAEAMAAEVRSRPASEPPLACLAAVLLDHVLSQPAKMPAALAIGRLIDATASLRAHSAEKYTIWERMLTEAVLEREGADDHATMVAPLAAAVAVGAFRVAARDWIDGNGEAKLSDLLKVRFSMLDAL